MQHEGGEAATCSTGTPNGQRFKSVLLCFQSSSLLICLEKQCRKAQAPGPQHPTRRPKSCSWPPSGPNEANMAIWEMNQQVDDLRLSTPLCVTQPFKEINKSLKVKGKKKNKEESRVARIKTSAHMKGGRCKGMARPQCQPQCWLSFLTPASCYRRLRGSGLVLSPRRRPALAPGFLIYCRPLGSTSMNGWKHSYSSSPSPSNSVF